MPKTRYQQHPVVLEMLSSLDENQRELYEERAGILEFDARLDRPFAEALALLEVIRLYGWPSKHTDDIRKFSHLI